MNADRAESTRRRERLDGTEWLALGSLGVGGVLVCGWLLLRLLGIEGLGWLLGLMLMGLLAAFAGLAGLFAMAGSPHWTLRDKIIGTLLVGGPLLALLIPILPTITADGPSLIMTRAVLDGPIACGVGCLIGVIYLWFAIRRRVSIQPGG
jgi:nicotinamide riboside transporter PnuC